MTNDDDSYIRGLTDDELERDKRCLALARSLREKQCSNDEILSRLREAGYSRASSLKAVVAIDGICLRPPLPDYADVLTELEEFDDEAEWRCAGFQYR